MVVSPTTGGGGARLRRFMSALLLLLSFAAARAAVAMVSRLAGWRLGCPLYGTASLRVTAGRLGTNECVLALPRVACAVQLRTPSKPYKASASLLSWALRGAARTHGRCKAGLAAVGASPRQA